MKHLFTSEAVTEGHPDKLCDRISDAVLDAMLEKDPMGRVACETFATTGLVVMGGEISTNCYVDIPKLVRETICEVGYDRPEAGFDGNTCAVLTSIDSQSPDISMGVTSSMEIKEGRTKEKAALLGAGDQGMMFGYACDETDDLMPLPITLANKLAYQLTQARKTGAIPFILPDGKTQVTVSYGPDGKPLGLETIVISTQHLPGVEQMDLVTALVDHVLHPAIGDMSLEGVRILVNPTGRFVKGGPAADTGLTGRKIIVDTYGGYARHGGGAFSGKDPTKVDRSAAYMARYIAKNVVAAGLANERKRTHWKECHPREAYQKGRGCQQRSLSNARCSLPTPSASPTRSPSWWIPSAPATRRTQSWQTPSARCSICGQRQSSTSSCCAGPSTRLRPPTVTSGTPWASP